MNIYFYDISSSCYNRFGNNISERLVKDKENINIFYIHDNYDDGEIILNDEARNVVTILSRNEVKNYINKYKPDVFICFSFRIPDNYWTHYFNSLSVRTIQIQHGLYVEEYKRTFRFLLSETKRSFSYLNYLIRLYLKTDNKKGVLANLLKKDFKIFDIDGEIDQDIAPDILITWGEYWENWFKNFLNYNSLTRFEICGSFDYNILENEENKLKNDSKSATYICQTLVEDGRLSLKEFNVFLKQLIAFSDEFDHTLYIKLHPRSNRENFKALGKKKNVVITDKFPISDYYLGHSSTLLTVCSHLEKKVLLIEFPGHKIPEIFKKICGGIAPYNDTIKFESVRKSDTSITEYYCKFIKDPFGKIVEVILKNDTENNIKGP